MDVAEWQQEICGGVAATAGVSDVEVELTYASFASLGQAADSCAKSKPEWGPYAEDVNAQLRVKGLLRYDGAPVLDDLENLTIPNAVEAFNRSIKAARAFFLELHSHARFPDLDLAPLRKEHAMFRNGGSETLTRPVEWFETTVAMTVYKRKNWDPQRWVFVCFDLLGETHTHADPLRRTCSGFRNHDLRLGSQWLFARRPWLAGSASPRLNAETFCRIPTWEEAESDVLVEKFAETAAEDVRLDDRSTARRGRTLGRNHRPNTRHD